MTFRFMSVGGNMYALSLLTATLFAMERETETPERTPGIQATV